MARNRNGQSDPEVAFVRAPMGQQGQQSQSEARRKEIEDLDDVRVHH